MWPALVTGDATLELQTERGRIHVDAAGGDFRVETESRGIWEIGASRAGVRDVVRLAHEQLALWPTRDQEQVLHAALHACLRHAAGDAITPGISADVERIRRTPLLYARELREQPHLLADAARFRPCRIAIARVEDDDDRDATPERVGALVERLASWRDLYAHGNKAARALNATLAEHGEVLDADALWGLRRVELTRRPPSRAHAELLGLLGAHPRALRLRSHMVVVEETAVNELRVILERVPIEARGLAGINAEASPVAALAELLASCAVPMAPQVRLRELFSAALKHQLEHIAPATPTARPPIPLPHHHELQWLDTVAALMREGERMDHCVATRRAEAVLGEMYLFRVDDGNGGWATVQVDNQGRVVEARGPKNRQNSTATWAHRVLTRWGRGFWAARLGMGEKTWHASTLPPRAMPLFRVEDCYRQYARAASAVPDDDGALAAWYVEHVTRAVRGELSMACDPQPSEVPFVLAVGRDGAIVSRAEDVRATR